MKLESPHLSQPLKPTPENIAEVIESLPTRKEGDRFAILGEDSQNYVQTLSTPEGFQLEYQDGSVAEHYHCTREDLSAAEVIEIFRDYLAGDIFWKRRFQFERRHLPTPWFHVGYGVGKFFGGIANLFRTPKV